MDAALLEAWENSVWHSKNLQRSVEDLGAAMYPPQVGHALGMGWRTHQLEGLWVSCGGPWLSRRRQQGRQRVWGQQRKCCRQRAPFGAGGGVLGWQDKIGVASRGPLTS